MIYTSYFAMDRKIPDTVKRLSIARWTPRWYKENIGIKLAPPEDILREYKKTGDFEKLSKGYKERVLDKLDLVEVLFYIEERTNSILLSDDVVLLCYEKSDCPCHRRLLREWLNEKGIKCEEYNFNKENIK